MSSSLSMPSSCSEEMPNSAAKSCIRVVVTYPSKDASPRASPASATPTACTGGRPSPAPNSPAPGPRTIGTPRARARRSTLSRVRPLASAASTTHRNPSRCSLARTPAPSGPRIQVDLPGGGLGGEPYVVAVRTDGELQLVLVHNRLDRLGLGIREHAGHARRRERQLREALGVGRPRDDVDALAAQLVHYGLHARAFEPHAGAHRIDRIVTGRDGDFGAAPRLARRGADLDDLLLNLRHFELEQGLDEQRVGAGQDQPRPLRGLLDALQDRPNRVTLVEVLAVVLLAVGDDGFGFTKFRQHHHDLAALDLLGLPQQELADFVGELFADPGALALAHPLDDALLRGLHGGAPERLEGHFLLEHVADLEVRVLEARFLERHLRARVLHGLDHRAEHDDPDRAL